MARVMHSMELDDDEDRYEGLPAIAENPPGPEYPSELCICLTDRVLDKMGMDDDLEKDDLIHLFAMVKVTSVKKIDDCTRIECQIVAMGAEEEMSETEPDND